MPELKIPKSMINVDPENASSSAEIPDASGIFGNIEDIAASVGDRSEKDKDKDFNLEGYYSGSSYTAGNRYPGGREISGCPAVRRNGRAGGY